MPNVDLNECMALEDIKPAKGQNRCSECDESFESSYPLENHVQTIHNKKKEHKCDECDAEFLFGWKLHKHMKLHQDKTIRKCYYYNNDIKCPFEKDGCKFAHIVAEKCKFAKKCQKTKCHLSTTIIRCYLVPILEI